MSFQSLFQEIVSDYPSRAAVVSSENTATTYTVLRRRVDSLSRSLRELGCLPGSRVVYAKCADAPYLEVFLATVQIGAVFCPLSPRSAPDELRERLALLEPDFLVADTEVLSILAEDLPALLPCRRTIAYPTSKQFLSYTGMTRKQFVLRQVEVPGDAPAVAILNEDTMEIQWITHNQLCQWLEECRRILRHPPGVSLLCIPFTCLAYIQEICLGLACGDTLLPEGSFTPKDFIKIISNQKVTSVFLTPSIIRTVSMDSGFLIGDFLSLRHVRCGQAYFDRPTAQRLKALLPPGCTVEKYTGFPSCVARLTLSIAEIDQEDWTAAPINSIGYPAGDFRIGALSPDGSPLPVGKQGPLHIQRDGKIWESLGYDGWLNETSLIFSCKVQARRSMQDGTSFSAVCSGMSNLSTDNLSSSFSLSRYLTIFDTFSAISPHTSTSKFARDCCESVLDRLPKCAAAALAIPRRSLQASITRRFVIQETESTTIFPALPTSFWIKTSKGFRQVDVQSMKSSPCLRLECHPIYATGRSLMGELYLAVPADVELTPQDSSVLLLILRHLTVLLAVHREFADATTRMELYQQAIELAGDGIGISGLEVKPVLLFANSKSARFINMGKDDPDFGAKLEKTQTANLQDLRQGGEVRSSRSFFYDDPDRGKTWVNYRTEKIIIDGESYAIAYCNRQESSGDVTHLEGLLSDRELDIVELITHGLTNKEIAARLDVSVNTVKFHLGRIFKKMQVTSRTELLSNTYLRKK